MVSLGDSSACMTAALACARVWLHVGEFRVEQRLDAIDRHLLDDVDMLAATVVAPSG
jgi:hypothetical protein